MKRLSLFFFLIFSTTAIQSQCLQIESILVDACVPGGGCTNNGSPACNCEGKNEMIRFNSGSTPILLSDIYIDFPSNSYLGIQAPNATTASLTATLNATILGCGYLLEPVSGTIPANKQVLLITSTDMCTTANSFANLNDTLYLIYQVAGNFSGHFANCSGTGNRTLIMGLNSQPSCWDTVSYNCQLLINVNGNYTCTPSLMDGSTVNYDNAGNPSYVNYGCQAPFTPLGVDAIAPASVCENGSINLSATATGAYSTITWTGGTGTFSNPNSLNTSYTPGSGESGTVTVYATLNTVCSTTVVDSVQFTISMLPSASVSSAPGLNFCQGQTATLSAGGGTSYTWLPSMASGTTFNTDSAGTFAVVASNTCGNDTAFITLQVTPLPVVSVNANGPVTFCNGNSVTLNASGASTYTWSNSQSGTAITVNSSGFYYVTGTDACGSDSAGIQVTVIQLPTVSLNQSNGSICNGDSVLVIATASNNNGLSWSPAASFNDSVYFFAAGTYTVTADNACGMDAAVFTLQTVASPSVSISASGTLTFCSGSSVTLTASGAGSFLWNNSQTGSSITVNSSGFYYVTGTATCGTDTEGVSVNVLPLPTLSLNTNTATVCSGDSILLIASNGGNSTLSWSPSSFTNDSIYVSTAGNYSATATNTCGTSTASFILNTENPLNISVSTSNDSICQGSQTTLNASGASAYTWSTGSGSSSITVNSAGTYFAIASNTCGSDTAFINIAVITAPTVTAFASQTVLCNGQNATLSATVTGSGSLIWSNGSGNNPLVVTSAGTYYAISANSCGTDSSAAIVITAASSPVAGILNSQNTLCPGDSLMLTAQGNGSYSWSNGSSSTSQYISQPGTYILTVTNSCGTDTAAVTISQSAINAQFTANPTTGIYPLNVNFSNSSTNAVTYTWSFGNGNTSTAINPAELFQNPGTYTVTLTATNSNGCSDSQTLVIIVLSEASYIVVPNIFSPNGDGLNEALLLSYYGISEFQMTIYDRWGLKMFSSTDISVSWDGKNLNGNNCPDGTYFYMLSAKGVDGNSIEANGSVTLVK